MYRAAVGFIRSSQTVDSITGHVEQAAVDLLADRHSYRLAGITHFSATHQALGTVHRYRANAVLTEVLLHFQNQFVPVFTGQLQRVEYLRELAVATKIYVHHRTDYLLDLTNVCHKYVL